MLKEDVLNAVQAAKTAAGNLLLKAELIQRGTAVHTPGQAPTYPEVRWNVSAMWTKFEAKEIDNERVLATDGKLIVFPEDGVPTPEPNHTIEISEEGVEYRIVYNDKVKVGSALALSQLQVRVLRKL